MSRWLIWDVCGCWKRALSSLQSPHLGWRELGPADSCDSHISFLCSLLRKFSHKVREGPTEKEVKWTVAEKEREGLYWPEYGSWIRPCLKLFVLVFHLWVTLFPLLWSQFELGLCNFQPKEFQLTHLLLRYVVKIKWDHFSKRFKTAA